MPIGDNNAPRPNYPGAYGYLAESVRGAIWRLRNGNYTVEEVAAWLEADLRDADGIKEKGTING